MLTAKQSQLLEFIHGRLQESGVSPSFDEMKDALGLKSKSGVHRLINALEERGFIKRLANRARALEVLKLPESIGQKVSSVSDNVVLGQFGRSADRPRSAVPDDMIEIPLHGKIAAGTPIEAIQNPDSFIPVPSAMAGRGNCFALEVSGESMVELGILDGDTVIIEGTQTARDGEIVVALVDREEATLKTIERRGRQVALIPANRDFETQIVPAENVQVQGRLVGLFRRYH